MPVDLIDAFMSDKMITSLLKFDIMEEILEKKFPKIGVSVENNRNLCRVIEENKNAQWWCNNGIKTLN